MMFARRAALVVRQALRLRLTAVGVSPLFVVAIPAAFVMVSLLMMAATSLSPSQERERDFGVFDAFAGYGVVELGPGDDLAGRTMLSAAESARPDEAMLSINAVDFYLEGMAEPEARFEEHAWSTVPFPDRYRLTAGAWPRRSGEVAVAGDGTVSTGQELTVAGGTTLRVVALVEDRYARGPAVLAGPGTWANLDPALANKYVTVRAQPVVYWEGGDDMEVLGALRATLPRGAVGEDDAQETLNTSFAAAPDASSPRAAPWKDKLPALYAVPSVLFPVLTVGLACLFSDHRRKRLLAVGRALGVPRYVLIAGHLLPLGLALTVASMLGGGAGVATMYLARPFLEDLAGRPVDLDVDWLGPLAVYTLIVGLAVVLAGLLFLNTRVRKDRGQVTEEPSKRATVRRIPFVEVRRLFALGLACAGVLMSATIETPPDALAASMALMAAVILVVPDLFDAVASRVSTQRWLLQLGLIRVSSRRTASLATMITLAAITGLTFGYLVLLQTWLTSAQAERAPEVSRNEVLVTARASQLFTAPPSTVDLVEQAVSPSTHPIPLRWTIETNETSGATLSLASLEGSFKPLLVASNRDEAKSMVGRKLTQGEQQILDSGGAVVWHGGDIPGRVSTQATIPLLLTDGEKQPQQVNSDLPVLLSPVPPNAWRLSASGIVTQKTADRLDLPIEEGAVLFAGVDPPESTAVEKAIRASAVDPKTVLTYSAPEPIIPALVLPGVAAALCALLFFQNVAATWTSSRANLKFLRLLVTVGITPRTAKTVLWIQYAVIFIGAAAIGTILAALPVTVLLLTLPGYQLSIPTMNLTILGLAIVVACAGAMTLSTLRVRASLRSLTFE